MIPRHRFGTTRRLDEEGGRGLAIVAALCQQWHYRPSSRGGKVVSAELTVPRGMLSAAGLRRRVQSAPAAAVTRDDFFSDPAPLRRIHRIRLWPSKGKQGHAHTALLSAQEERLGDAVNRVAPGRVAVRAR